MYVLFTCDRHKSTDSMRLIGLATDMPHVRTAVKKLIQNEIIGEDSDIDDLDEIDDMDMYELNTNVTYFHLADVPINDIETGGAYYI